MSLNLQGQVAVLRNDVSYIKASLEKNEGQIGIIHRRIDKVLKSLTNPGLTVKHRAVIWAEDNWSKFAIGIITLLAGIIFGNQ